MRVRTYYRGPDAVVTSEIFVWRTSPPRSFAIRELRNVGVASRAVDRSRPYGTQAAAGSVVLAVAIWPVMDTPVLFLAAFLSVAIPAVAVAAYWRMRPRQWELHATYRGADVLLYVSVDERKFNQVRRALQRAMEDADPHAPVRGKAAA